MEKDGSQRLSFFVVALLGFARNGIFVHLATNVLSFPDWSAVIFILAVTLITVYLLLPS